VRRRRLPPGTWSSSQAESPSGSFDSVQRIVLPAPVVECTTAGARRLGELYWRELERSTLGLVRVRGEDALALRVLGLGPALLRFGAPELAVGPDAVSCTYAIQGGLLARSPGGSISFTQTGAEDVELRTSLTGFFPRLASRRARRRGGLLYAQGQARLHVALGRSWFTRLWREAAE
jgi:hypothetical protein